MKLRRAERADRDQLLEVHTMAIRELCATHYTASELEAWCGRLNRESYERVIEEREFLVCVDAGILLGFGQLNSASGEVEAIYVRPSSVHRGVGSALLHELEKTARTLGLRELFLDSSLNAVPFYSRAGFRIIERSVHYLTAVTAIACVRMTKSLAQRADDGP